VTARGREQNAARAPGQKASHAHEGHAERRPAKPLTPAQQPTRGQHDDRESADDGEPLTDDEALARAMEGVRQLPTDVRSERVPRARDDSRVLLPPHAAAPAEPSDDADAPGRDGKRSRRGDEISSEADEFARAMAGVRPLKPDVRSQRVRVDRGAADRRITLTPAPATPGGEADDPAQADARRLAELGPAAAREGHQDAAFAQAMADVRRLPRDVRSDRVRMQPATEDARVAVPAPPAAETPPAARPDDEARVEDEKYVAAGVDRRELRRLTRGDYSPSDTIDLHGLTAEEATERAAAFVDRSKGRHRCIAIVHGRGLRSPGNVAVLRGAVRERLRQHPAVLAFADAPAADGGAGAVYVLLRR
jgi:DNA-nicking Smr family endonuclease